MKKVLTKEEMLQLELNFEKQNGLTKEIVIKNYESKLLAQQQKMLELQMEILKLRQAAKKIEVKEHQDKRDSQKEQNREYTKVIAEKYELEEGWGFNPDTGEII